MLDLAQDLTHRGCQTAERVVMFWPMSTPPTSPAAVTNWKETADRMVQRLNADQKAIYAASLSPKGSTRYIRALACAGSGKTSVVATLLADGLNRGVLNPTSLVATTFTNKAAGELAQRIRLATNPAAYGALSGARRVGTFHSIALAWLRKNPEASNQGHRWALNLNLDTIPDPWDSFGGGAGKESPREKWLRMVEAESRRLGVGGRGADALFKNPKWIVQDLIGSPDPKNRNSPTWKTDPYRIDGLPLDVRGFMEKQGMDTSEVPSGGQYLQAIGVIRGYGLHPFYTPMTEVITITDPLNENKRLTFTGPREVAEHFETVFRLPLLGRVWRIYEQIKRNINAYDFEDALYWFWRSGTLGADLVIIDEAQDNTFIQLDLGRKIANRNNGRLLLVGDIRQCIPAGQPVSTPNGSIPVEQIQPGTTVWTSRSGKRASGVVTQVSSSVKPMAYEYTLADGRTFQATPEHALFSALPSEGGKPFTYLMYREGYGFRIGTAAASRNQDRHNILVRCNQEEADRLWVLGSFDSKEEALRLEHTLAYRWGVPMDPFKSRKAGVWETGTGAEVAAYFQEFQANGHKLLTHLGMCFDQPNLLTRGGGDRVVVNLLLGSKGGAEVAADSRLLPASGSIATFSLTAGSQQGGRLRRWFSSVPEATQAAQLLVASLREQGIPADLSERLSGTDQTVFTLPAASVHPGCLVPVLTEAGLALVEVVSRREVSCSVCYDLEVASAGNFCVNDVVVHNSIYSFRGANPAITRDANEGAGFLTLELSVNYRSGSNIVNLGNDLCYETSPHLEPDALRKTWAPGSNATSGRRVDPTTVRYVTFEQGSRGEPETIPYVPSTLEDQGPNRSDPWAATVRTREYNTAGEEAEGTAQEIAALLAQGVPAKDIAFLSRTNAEGAFTEVALLTQRVPVLRIGRGTPFFDTAPIRKVLQWLVGAFEDDASALNTVLEERGIYMKAVWPALRGMKGLPLRNTLHRLDRDEEANKYNKPSFREAVGDLDRIAKLPWTQAVEWIVSLLLARQTQSLEAQDESDTGAKLEASVDTDADALKSFLAIAALFESYTEFLRFRERLRTDVVSYSENQIAKLYQETPDMSEAERARVAADRATFERERDSRVTVTSIHSSKGLEWGWVYLTSSHGTFPSARATTPTQEAEEDRLGYVAITRARDVITVTYAGRAITGKLAGPSRLVTGYVTPFLRALSVATPTPQTAPAPPYATSPASPLHPAESPFEVPGWTLVLADLSGGQILWTQEGPPGTPSRTLELLRGTPVTSGVAATWGLYWSTPATEEDPTPEIRAASQAQWTTPYDAMPEVRALGQLPYVVDSASPPAAIPPLPDRSVWLPRLLRHLNAHPSAVVQVGTLRATYLDLARALVPASPVPSPATPKPAGATPKPGAAVKPAASGKPTTPPKPAARPALSATPVQATPPVPTRGLPSPDPDPDPSQIDPIKAHIDLLRKADAALVAGKRPYADPEFLADMARMPEALLKAAYQRSRSSLAREQDQMAAAISGRYATAGLVNDMLVTELRRRKAAL